MVMIREEITFIEYYAFLYFIAFNFYNNPRRYIWSFLFCRWRNKGSVGLRKLLKFMWLGSGGAGAESRFIWPQDPCLFHYASPPLSGTGNCQSSLAQNTIHKLCKAKGSCAFVRMVRFRELRRELKAQKQTHAQKNLI